MSTLHTVNKSPFDGTCLTSCLAHCLPGDAVILIEDGVVAARKGTAAAKAIEASLADCKVYVLGPDAAARGMNGETLVAGVESVDYGGFVELAATHDRTQSWL